MEAVNSFFHTNAGIAVLILLFLCIGFSLGFHSGNRFRMARLKLLDPADIKKRMKIIKINLQAAEDRLEYYYESSYDQKANKVNCHNEIARLKTEYETLEWVMSNAE